MGNTVCPRKSALSNGYPLRDLIANDKEENEDTTYQTRKPGAILSEPDLNPFKNKILLRLHISDAREKYWEGGPTTPIVLIRIKKKCQQCIEI